MEWYGINKPVYKIPDPEKQKKGYRKLLAVLVKTTDHNYAIVPRRAETKEALADAVTKVVSERSDIA